MRLALGVLLLTVTAAHAQLVNPNGPAPPGNDKAPGIDKPLADKPGVTRPVIVPTREASVLYRVSFGGNPPIELRVTALPNGGTMRIDLPDFTYMLVNQADKRLAMVVPNDQTVIDVPWSDSPVDQFVLNARMKFARRTADTVAANRCTIWEMTVDRTRGAVCVTDDGVLLRSVNQDETGRRNIIDAVSVSYTPAPANEFLPPPGFKHTTAPPNGFGPTQ